MTDPASDNEALIRELLWMMDWCRLRGLTPADNHCWELAKQAWEEEQRQ